MGQNPCGVPQICPKTLALKGVNAVCSFHLQWVAGCLPEHKSRSRSPRLASLTRGSKWGVSNSALGGYLWCIFVRATLSPSHPLQIPQELAWGKLLAQRWRVLQECPFPPSPDQPGARPAFSPKGLFPPALG